MATRMRDLPEIEILDGRARRKVSPRTKHAFVQFALAHAIEVSAGARGFTGTEWRFRVGAADGSNTLLVPDVAYVSSDRLAPLFGLDREEPPFAPDIAVEVRSPSDDIPFLAGKIRRYLATGAVLVLDVNPQDRSITAYTRDGERRFTSGERFVHSAVPWLEFEVASAFAKIALLEQLQDPQ